jgi:hypothetical protein
MSAPVAVRVEGLKAFTRAVKDVDRELPKAVRLANNRVVQIIVDGVQPKVPVKTGKARATVKAKSTRTAARISAGSKRAPYYAWLDFGGKTGIDGSVVRPFYKQGRYIYPTYSANRDRVVEVMVEEYAAIAREAGLEVST